MKLMKVINNLCGNMNYWLPVNLASACWTDAGTGQSSMGMCSESTEKRKSVFQKGAKSHLDFGIGTHNVDLEPFGKPPDLHSHIIMDLDLFGMHMHKHTIHNRSVQSNVCLFTHNLEIITM